MNRPVQLLFALLCGAGALNAQTAGGPADARFFVTLEYKPGFQNGCGPHKMEFVRTRGDGTAGTDPYRERAPSRTVITDVDWGYTGGPPNQFLVFRLLIQNLADPTKTSRAMESSVRLDGYGNGGASEHMTTGFVLLPEARICAEVPGEATGSVVRLWRVVLRGYQFLSQ